MKVAFLTSRTDKPSFRFRVAQFLPFLRAHGVTCDVFRVPRAGWRRWRLFRSLRGHDVVFLQKKLLRLLDLVVLRSAARRLVYDVDDAVMYRERGRLIELPAMRRRRFRATVKRADLVLAGNDFLCAWAANDAVGVVCFRTVVDTDHYRPAPREPREPYVVGWTGSRSTNRYLNMVLPFLSRLARRCRIVLRVVSDTQEGIDFRLSEGLETEFVRWDGENELRRLQSFDVGLMPLPDNEWVRGKCALKALLYMACGVPAVCSARGAVRNIITDGVNGILVGCGDDWCAKIERLLGDEATRERLIRNGRKTVVSRFSLSRAAPRLLGIFENLCGVSEEDREGAHKRDFPSLHRAESI